MASVSSAVAISPRKVRVTFSAAVDATALASSVWSFLGTGEPPFATPEVDTVDGVDSTTVPTVVDLFLTFDLSPGKPYTVTATGITGVSAPNNTADFAVDALPTVAGRKFSLISWIPKDDLRKDDTTDLRKFVAVFDDQLALLVDDVDKWADIQDPDLAEEPHVDQMLSDFGNPVSDAVLTLSKKRILVRCLIPLYKRSGTGPGLVDAIYFFLGLSASLVRLNRQGMRLGESLLAYDWILGCGPDKWRLVLRIATPDGRALTAYESRVVAQIIKFERRAEDVITTKVVLPAPTGVTAVGTEGGIRISWDTVENAVSYAVYTRTTTGVTLFNSTRWAAGTNTLEELMPSGQHRYFIVVAVNAQGDGLESAEVDAVSGV